MEPIDINDFMYEKDCIYEGERYSVRDNGAVFRHPRIEKRVRPNDNKWTFGIVNTSNPYLLLSSVRIHRIVATAFHGNPPDPQYVVDHMDTNCRNNRPENLRWVTRLENALMNPVTRKKIEFICGSIEVFLDDPSSLNGYEVEKNFAWMRTVTREEAQNCKERMAKWASKDKKPSGGTWGESVFKPIKESKIISKEAVLDILLRKEAQNSAVNVPLFSNIEQKTKNGSLSQWLYEPSKEREILDGERLTIALTQGCAQYKWGVPSYFPCCPEEIGTNPLETYFQNLRVGAVFAYNDVYPKSTIFDFVRIKNNGSILVLTEKENLKPWSVAEITFENGLFVHSNLGSFFLKIGADKVFCIEQGLEWTDGDALDDFC